MAYFVGIVLATIVCGSMTVIGFDRDRAFYPTVMIVIAMYYALFAVMGGAPGALIRESIPIAGFVLLAVLGFKRNLWFVVVALAGHGLFDFVHHYLIVDPGVPAWWPAFCLTYDVVAAAYLAALLVRGRLPARVRHVTPSGPA